MTPITLQIALPDDPLLSAEELHKITGRKPPRLQLAWLKDHEWEYTLDTDKGILVGRLYAHLRLAGMHPAQLLTPAAAAGFDLSATR